VRVELRETDDEDADRDRLDRVLEVLRDFPGDDEVRLTVHTLGGDSLAVALGRLRARSCDELTERLAAVLGRGSEVAS
jgi:hypothetical protein